MDSRHVKSINTDARSKKRIRFASSKERSKKASADVYRSYRNRIGGGVTSASTRESFVHNPQRNDVRTKTKPHRIDDDDRNLSIFVKLSKAPTVNNDDKVEVGLEKNGNVEMGTETTFASEVDVALDRNASEIFSKFYREIWILIRSLPEILHNLDKIIDILDSYLLSPSSMPDRPSLVPTNNSTSDGGDGLREEFVINHATTDILHLLSVLARDLRHEIHPYLHTKILPRIAQDLLNPPPPPSDSKKQPIPLDVTIVETAFRTISYIFRYDSNLVVDDMESMRKYYGITLGNRREIIRRLSAETFAPQIRKMKNHSSRERHIRRVFRALAATTKQPKSRILLRTQIEAVDGISNLLFQLIRGVPGKLHSQGCRILQFLLQYSCCDKKLMSEGSSNKNNENRSDGDCKQDLILSVASGVLGKLCYHLVDSGFATVCKELFSLLSVSIDSYEDSLKQEQEGKSPNIASSQPIINCLELIVHVATFRSGSLFQARTDHELTVFCDSISRLCSEVCLTSMSLQDRGTLVSLLCKAWLPLQDRQCINVGKNAQRVLESRYENVESIHSLSLIFAKNFLPHLNDISSRTTIMSKLITVSAQMAESDPNAALEVVFGVVTSNNRTLPPDSSTYLDNHKRRLCFDFFGKMAGINLSIEQEQQKRLLDACLCKFENDYDDKTDLCARFSLNIRCVPFLAALSGNNQTEKYKKSANWLIECFHSLQGANRSDTCVVKGLAIEAFSFLSLKATESSVHSSVIKKMISRVKSLVGKLLLEHRESLWAMRGAASLVPVLQKFSIGPLVDDGDNVFNSLMPNLRSANHFLRLYALQIMASYPEKVFVVDHADLDLTDDLDEDESYHPSGQEKSSKGGPVGPCDMIKNLLKLEMSPVRLEDEKQIITLIGRVEILGRTRRLPAVYAEIAANHMLGIFNVKFAPLWQSAEKTLVSLATAYEDIIWPSLETKLMDVMKGNTTLTTTTNESTGKIGSSSKNEHFDSCHKWEDSKGKDVSLFKSSLGLIEGEVPCYHTTDVETVMESVWKVAELGHKIVARHSRGIVPLFLQFLSEQYYAFHSNDQDARELHLNEFIETDTVALVKTQGFILQKRLKCFLRVFAAIEGPQQLLHHTVLEKVFLSFLTHPDPYVVGNSLLCLVKFKIDYLVPYHQHLREIIQKGKLKNALLKLTEEIETGKMNSKHRKQLLPILARVLFGRVTAKAGKSSKDSPAARRAAILSFMSVICKEEDDFFPFLYLMTRCFIPRTEKLKVIESFEPKDRSDLIDTLMRTRSVDLASLSSPVIEGFLHLLQSVLSQFGHQIISWIPQLTFITVELCKFVMITNEKPEHKLQGLEHGAEEVTTRSDIIRRSSIRTLCFQRLSNLFALFGSSVDFVPFSESMWFALQPSLDLLPEMVIRNEGCPAILNLLQTMSADPNLIKMLCLHDQSVYAVVKCITATSLTSVIQVSLTFIENLLTIIDEHSVVVGQELLRKYTPLLMEQFTIRLQAKEKPDDPDSVSKSLSKRKGKSTPAWRRELKILFRISELVSFGDWEMVTNDNSFLETLCDLLIPFLQPDRRILNEDKMNVLGILNGIVAKLEPYVGLAIFWKLSSTLAPYKSRVGIEMLSIRRSIAELIGKAAEKNPNLKSVTAIVMKLSSVNQARVDEIDFEVVVPELVSLAETSNKGYTWGYISDNSDSNPLFLTPLINVCFHFLHVEDGVISRASFNCLKSLVLTASSFIHKNEHTEAWIKMAESVLVPLSRSGLQCRDIKARRYYILLIRELSRNFCDISSANLCSDLRILCNDENHDLDFFLGITHVQIHRRARAFQRLRKTLYQIDSEVLVGKITPQSLSNVLLPLALHPVYECKSKSEEGFVLDSIATLGAIARQLSWSKYNNMLWVVLSQFDRYPDQQRYSVGALCAIIDGFNFELTKQNNTSSTTSMEKTSVWNSLENRIIPKIEGLLSKETTGKNGSRGKILRPAVMLALVKLFQKFPENFFESKLPVILAIICDALRNKDSSARDIARNTLAKIVCFVEMKYLGDVIREITITLNEGYKLHVRAATVHSILLQLSSVYQPPPIDSVEEASVPFDDCTAAIMDLIQEDLFGEANERRESRDTNVRFVKEAGGNKSVHSIEMLCRMISFAPSKARNGNQSRSAVHCIVSPLLERLRLPNIDAKMIRKIKELLSRIAIGISNNKSLTASQLFPFVYATIHPFIGSDAIATNEHDEEETDYDGNGDMVIKVSGGKNVKSLNKSNSTQGVASVAEWRPSTIKSSGSAKTASSVKKNDSHGLRKVQDGASAPKLTGSSRHNMLKTLDIKAINEPATITAIVFGLNLMNACLKKLEIRNDQSLCMMDPFVPMLTACVCHCRDTEVALVALKCLLVLLRSDLPSIPSCSKSLGSKTLSLLTFAGSSLNTNHDLTQASFKTLTHLIGTAKNTRAADTLSVKEDYGHGITGDLPLNTEQMKVLISLIQASITESDQHNPALNLIKVILMRQYASPEFYDLMESMTKLVVRSPKATLRQICAGLFVRYLLDYPMGEERFQQHLKQVVANISYEYQEGRVSGIILLTLIMEKLPKELLQRHAQLLFLPLVLQLRNDDSKDCREHLSKCILLLLKRSSTELLRTFQEYCLRWSQQTGPLRLASLQVFGYFIDSRADFIKTSSMEISLMNHLEHNLKQRQEADWEITYFSLVCIEKLFKDFGNVLIQQAELLTNVTECLIEPHPWIKLCSSRIINAFLISNSATLFLSQRDGMLFEIVRNLLFQLNVPEEDYNQDLSELIIKTLTFALPLISEHPQFCYTNSEDDDNIQSDKERDPVFWLLRRLSQIAKNKGSRRRMTVYKCFAAFSANNFHLVAPYLELMLEGLHRTSTEAKNEIENEALSQKRSSSFAVLGVLNGDGDVPVTEHSLAEVVMGLLEDRCTSPSDFLIAYADVKRRALIKKTRRINDQKIEAVQNPLVAAERRIEKQQRNKNRRKRRADEHRQDRGRGEKKYRFR